MQNNSNKALYLTQPNTSTASFFLPDFFSDIATNNVQFLLIPIDPHELHEFEQGKSTFRYSYEL